MREEIVILSDIYGHCLSNYESLFSSDYAITVYDSLSLGEIERQGYDSGMVHEQMVSRGIDHAVQKLLQTENQAKHYIGCSIGGLIVWKAALKGLPINNLLAFSSTRLRYEKDYPPCPYILYFGSNDDYAPDASWMQKMGIENCRMITGDHEFYRDEKRIKPILDKLIAQHWFK